MLYHPVSSLRVFQRSIKEDLSKMVFPSCLGAEVSVGAVLYSATRTSIKEEAIARYGWVTTGA